MLGLTSWLMSGCVPRPPDEVESIKIGFPIQKRLINKWREVNRNLLGEKFMLEANNSGMING